jgi:hypothetical protein
MGLFIGIYKMIEYGNVLPEIGRKFRPVYKKFFRWVSADVHNFARAILFC